MIPRRPKLHTPQAENLLLSHAKPPRREGTGSPIFHSPFSILRSHRSFALVSTLLVITVLSVMVAGFLASIRVERLTARSYLNIIKAELAVRSGLEAAKASLMMGTVNDHFIVVASTNANGRFYYIGNAEGTPAGQIRYTPLFSGGQTVTTNINGLPSPAFDPSVDPAPKQPRLSPHLPPVTNAWIIVNDAYNRPAFRYTYWIEDLAGYLDARSVGNMDNGGKHQRRHGTNTFDIALYSLFEPSLNQDSGLTAATNIIQFRSLALTTETVKQLVENTAGHALVSTNVIVNLHHDSEEEIIPFGLGYLDEGKSKHQINTLIANRDVGGIAEVIDQNLPNFASSRKGGLRPIHNYSKTIAANIIDYADADSEATVGTDYRGLDAYPLVSEIYNRFEMTSPKPTGPVTSIQLSVTTYVELWNMTSKATSGIVTLRNKNRFGITGFNGSHYFSDEGPWTVSVNLLPNEYYVIGFPPATYTFTSPIPIDLRRPLPTGQPSVLFISANNESSYELEWEPTGAPKRLVDMARGGVTRQLGTLRWGNSEIKVSGSIPGHSYEWPLGTYYNNPGDPRSAWYNEGSQGANDYDRNSSAWGRNVRASISGGSHIVHREVKPSAWYDRGHDSPAGLVVRPDSKPFDDTSIKANRPPTATNMSVQIIANHPDGKLRSVSELGHIYDPAQWQQPWLAGTSSGYWHDINSTATPSDRFGGGFTLRIGRPEFTRFDQQGTRASQLLDLFAVTPTRSTKGLINLNTATFDALRALGAGVNHERDSLISPSSVTEPHLGRSGDQFAEAVVASRPFITTSKLATMTNRYGVFFGNTNQWRNAGSRPILWSDSAAEEYFAKVYNLATVRSRNFRIFVSGQALNANGQPISTASRSFQAFLRPTRDISGRITSTELQIDHANSL